MKKIFYTATLLSLGLGNCLFSVPVTSSTVPEAASQTIPSTTTTPSTTTSSTTVQETKTVTKSSDDTQMAGWMIESAQAAKEYVEAIDRGDFGQSWTKGDQLFQHTISQKEWEKALTDNRKPLGKLKSRSLKDQRPAKDPHGLPRGAYMVVEYNTAFENAPASGELLTLRRGSDGKWRVLTYQVN